MGDKHFAPDQSPKTRKQMADAMSLLPEFVYDPAMYLKVAGLTDAGEELAKGGKGAEDFAHDQATQQYLQGVHAGQAPELPSTSQAEQQLASKSNELAPRMGASLLDDLDQGNKSALSFGGKTIIPGSVISETVHGLGQSLTDILDSIENLPFIGSPVGKARDFANTVKEGFNPMTNDAQFNALKMASVNKTNYQKQLSNLETPETTRFIEDHAASQGMTPTIMKKNILDYLEPRDIYGPGAREEAAQKLSPDVKAYADQLQQTFKEAQQREANTGTIGYPPIENYVPHVRTPEANDWVSKNIPSEDQEKVLGSLSGLDKTFQEQRNVNMTVNEVNNLFAQGRGSEVPGLAGFKKLDEFKGKYFNDNIEDIAARRDLQSKKVENEHDFLQQTGKTYGKPWEEVQNSNNPTDYVSHTSPSYKGIQGATPEGKMWFPKEIGNYLNRSQQLTTGKFITPWLNFFKGLNNLTKKMNFGIWPGSAVKIELGNNQLAFLSDLWSPHSQWVGHSIATKIRQGGMEALDDSTPIINSPKLGALTEKDIYQMAMEHRGIGMGLARQELESMQPEKQGLGIAKAGWALHQYVEDGTRMGTFVDALKKGYDADAAGEATQKALYDYSKMGPIPDTLRQFLPFFTFAYKNAPAMLGKLATNPGKMELYDKAREMLNKPVQDQEQYQKEWQSDNMPIYMGTAKDGKDYYLYGNKFMPQTDMDEWLGSGKSIGEALENTPGKLAHYAFDLQNPYLKTLLEEGFNKSTYFDQAIRRMNGEVEPTGFGFNLPAKESYAVRNTIRAPSEVGKATDQSTPFGLRMAHLLSGLNIQGVDPYIQQLNKEREDMASVKGSGAKVGGEADVKYYYALYNHYLMNGDDQKAETALENYNTAQKNLEESMTELEGGK